MKKGFIFISIIVVLAAILFVLYLFQTNRRTVGSMFKAVPLDAAFIIDVSDYHTFRDGLASNKALATDFLSISSFKDIRFDLALIDSFTKINEALKLIVSQPHPIMVSGHPSRKDDIQCIYYFRVPASDEFNFIDKAIKSSHGVMVGSKRDYENAGIQDIILLGTKNEGFSYVWVDDLFMISRSSILLEDAIRQIGSKDNILLHNRLNEIVKTAGKTSFMNIFLNFEQLPRLASQLIHAKYKNEINTVKNFGNWAELDLNIKPEMILLNGFSSPNENKPGFVTLFKNQKPIKFESFTKIPATVGTFALVSIPNFDQYWKDYQVISETNENKSALQDLKMNFNIDLPASFRNLLDRESGIVYLNNDNDTFQNNAFTLIRVKNREEAESMLTNLIDNYVEKVNLKSSDLIKTTNKEPGNDLKLYHLPFCNVPALVLGNFFNISDNHYCTVFDNYIIFGRTPESITYYLEQLSIGQYINNDLEFNNLSENFSSQSNFFFYHNPSNSINFYNNFLKRDIASEITSQISKFNSLRALVYQFTVGDNGLLYNNIIFKFTTSVRQEKHTTNWETQLEDEVVGKPVFLKNNHDKDEEIVVQDRKNQIYLINGKGSVLWKYSLPEPILSDIYQIDYYKNGKLQILFNTHSKIYLLDRKGKTVENFPVTLRTQATNGISVFDYEKTREYRLFLATEDGKILCLDKKADPVEGWNCQPTDNKVSQPVQFFRIESKDILTYTDQNRIYIVDRKGTSIEKTIQKFPVSNMNKVVLVNSRSLKEARLVITDTTGKVFLSALDGKINTVDCGVYPARHWFDMADVDGDGSKDFIFTWDHTVKACTQKGKMLFTVTGDQDITYRPVFYELKTNQTLFSTVTISNGNINLYKGNGKLMNGFPLIGNTQFSIKHMNNSENKFNLIVGSKPNFLYEYSVQLTIDK